MDRTEYVISISVTLETWFKNGGKIIFHAKTPTVEVGVPIAFMDNTWTAHLKQKMKEKSSWNVP